MENPIEELERLSFCFDKMDKNNYYMKQQFTNFSKSIAIKINFNYCHISIRYQKRMKVSHIDYVFLLKSIDI